jgi:hypothetical protein
MQKKLGAGYRIEGYFPQGFTVPPWPTDSAGTARMVVPVNGASVSFHFAKHYHPNPPHPKRNEILDLWATGKLTGTQIAKQLGLRTGAQVTALVSSAREGGDKRAVRRHRMTES